MELTFTVLQKKLSNDFITIFSHYYVLYKVSFNTSLNDELFTDDH